MELKGKVVVLPVGWEPGVGLAQRLAGRGATVVLVGPDGEEAGRVAATIEGSGPGRPAVFVTDGSEAGLDALVGFLSEIYRTP